MFGANPMVDLMPKRYGVTMRSLPPIETLQPETLKDFTKEDLRCYLEAAGITPGITKPEMKRQMRSLINQLTGNDDKFNTPFPVSLQPNFASPVPYIPTPLTSPPAIGGGGLPNFAEGDIQCPDCPKKGNKECQYKRCRTCCLRKMQEAGYRCGPHIRDAERSRLTQRHSNFVTPQTPGTPTNPSYPTPSPPITRSSTMPPPPPRFAAPLPSLPLPPTPSTVVSPIQPVPTSSVIAHSAVPPPVPIPQSAHPSFSSFPSFPSAAPPPGPSAIPQQPNFVLSLPTLQPPSPMEPGEVSPYSVAECPRCHKVVSTLGANLWLHLKECDPDHIMDYVRLLHEGRLSTPTLTEKEKADPIRIAYQNATQRSQQNITYLSELFSSTSVDELIAWHAKLPSREEEQKRAIETYTKAMEKFTGILTHTVDKDNGNESEFLASFKDRSDSFYRHLDLLDSCTTVEEVASRAKEFENELELRMEPEPVLVRIAIDVAQRKNADADARARAEEDGKGENGKHVYDKEMVDVSETTPLSLVAL